MLDNTRAVCQGSRQGEWLRDACGKIAASQVVAIVRHRWQITFTGQQTHLAAKRFKPAQVGSGFEGEDLNREWAAGAQASDELRFIHNDNQLLGMNLHNFLTQERPTQPFDQVQVGIHLIGAIHSQIQNRMILQGGQRDFRQARLAEAFMLGGHGANIAQVSLPNALA